MRVKLFLYLAVLYVLCFGWTARAAVTRYSQNETGFQEAIASLESTLVDFDSLAQGEVIADQFLSRNAAFSTRAGKVITAETIAAGPSAYSPPLCAAVEYEEGIQSTFTIAFPEPVWGVSLWVLDINFSEFVTFSVLDSASSPLGSFNEYRHGDYSYLAVLSDSEDIGSIVVTTHSTGDAIGFDDVTVVPEPTTVWLLAFGGLRLIRRRRR
ncbi:MAG: PEP-CTERM sorting domain-containing protein [Phycisphaerae bacterium]|nr:PEP-CTERM sorting domain-containing protein [Phycisphaerae bacterium]